MPQGGQARGRLAPDCLPGAFELVDTPDELQYTSGLIRSSATLAAPSVLTSISIQLI